MLQGKNIYLRGLEEKDLSTIMAWRNQKEIRRFFFYKGLLTVAGQQKWFESYTADSAREIFIACAKSDHRPIGMIGLYNIDVINHKAELGSTIVGDRSMHGKGIATEMIELLLEYAFVDLNLNRIYAYTIDYNTASARVKEKCGFVKEGILRQDHYTNGTFHDVYIFGLTRTDWQKETEGGRDGV